MPVVDTNKCIGCGVCANILDEVFQVGNEGYAEVIGTAGDDQIQDAVDSCPVGAISL